MNAVKRESRRQQDLETIQRKNKRSLPLYVSPPQISVAFHTPVTDRQDGFPRTNQGREVLIGQKRGGRGLKWL